MDKAELARLEQCERSIIDLLHRVVALEKQDEIWEALSESEGGE